jgi:hypothetical protein
MMSPSRNEARQVSAQDCRGLLVGDAQLFENPDLRLELILLPPSGEEARVRPVENALGAKDIQAPLENLGERQRRRKA